MGKSSKQDRFPSLVVAVDEIPEPGLERAGDLPPEWAAESILPAYVATSPVHLSLRAQRYHDNVHVELELRVELAFECSRTLAPGTRTLTVRCGEVFQPEGRHGLNLGAGVDADDVSVDEPWTYADRHIDLEPLVREQLVLAQDPYPVLEPAPDDGDEVPAWSSGDAPVDPRWAALQKLKLG